ncbi:MAG: ABC transporter ATP-binding protein [Methylobacterium sp.]
MLARPDTVPPAFEARGLTIDFPARAGSVRAVDDVSFSASEGERLVLLGRSGCGKSSILKALAGFVRPSAGEIRVKGHRITGAGPDRIVVFQEFDQLLPWKTVRDNVAFPLRVSTRPGGKLAKAQARELAAEALRKVGLERAIDAFPHTLSGGMKQRAAIARALVTNADVLLMDEPFAALDALTRRQLQEDLLALAEAERFTLLFVTHSIEEAILVGTKLHLLSPHPGRTIASFDTSEFGLGNSGGARFDGVVREVNDLLFGQAGGTRPARETEAAHV